MYNDYGYYNFNMIKENPSLMNEREKIPPKIIDNIKQPEFIDEVAYDELAYIINLAHRKKVNIIGFYYPYYIEKYDQARFKSYKDQISKLFNKHDFIWDMNTDEYLPLRTNIANYYDKAHLSYAGTHLVIQDIKDKLELYQKEH